MPIQINFYFFYMCHILASLLLVYSAYITKPVTKHK